MLSLTKLIVGRNASDIKSERSLCIPPEVMATIDVVARKKEMSREAVIVAVLSQWSDEPIFRRVEA